MLERGMDLTSQKGARVESKRSLNPDTMPLPLYQCQRGEGKVDLDPENVNALSRVKTDPTTMPMTGSKRYWKIALEGLGRRSRNHRDLDFLNDWTRQIMHHRHGKSLEEGGEGRGVIQVLNIDMSLPPRASKI